MWKTVRVEYVDSWELEQVIKKAYAERWKVNEADLLVEWQYDSGYSCGCCPTERTFDGARISVFEKIVRKPRVKKPTTKKGQKGNAKKTTGRK